MNNIEFFQKKNCFSQLSYGLIEWCVYIPLIYLIRVLIIIFISVCGI